MNVCPLCSDPCDRGSEHCKAFTRGRGCRGIHYPAPWWFKVAMVLFPGRCRAIPEANNPDHCVLRQVAIVKRYVYLQQFASAEDREWMHSHQWEWTIAVGLWGGYAEFRLAGRPKKRTAPYFYTMDSSIVHHVQSVTPGHTSVFVGLFRNDDLKFYFPAYGEKRHWETHIKAQVKRV